MTATNLPVGPARALSRMPAQKLDPRSRARRIIDAVMAVTAPRRALKGLAAADFDVSTQRIPEISALEPAIIERKRLESESLTRWRLQSLRVIHAVSVAFVLSAVGVGAFVGWVFGPLGTTTKSVSTLGSVCVFAWAALARLGWAEQSIKGDTSVERIDEVLFRLLVWVGTLLAAISIL